MMENVFGHVRVEYISHLGRRELLNRSDITRSEATVRHVMAGEALSIRRPFLNATGTNFRPIIQVSSFYWHSYIVENDCANKNRRVFARRRWRPLSLVRRPCAHICSQYCAAYAYLGCRSLRPWRTLIYIHYYSSHSRLSFWQLWLLTLQSSARHFFTVAVQLETAA